MLKDNTQMTLDLSSYQELYDAIILKNHILRKLKDNMQTINSACYLSRSFLRDHKSKLFGFSRKSIIPITTMPSSLRQSLIRSFTTIIFLKESPIRTREFFS